MKSKVRLLTLYFHFLFYSHLLIFFFGHLGAEERHNDYKTNMAMANESRESEATSGSEKNKTMRYETLRVVVVPESQIFL